MSDTDGPPRVVIIRSFYNEHGDLLAEGGTTREIDCTPDADDIEDGLSAVALAVRQMRDCFYLTDASSYPTWGGMGTWYTATYEPDQLSPAGAVQEECSGHVSGFTPAQARQIYAMMTGRDG